MLWLELKLPDGTFLHESRKTTEELMTIVREHYPCAIRQASWGMAGHDLDDRWRYASIAIWPNGSAKELDAAQFRSVGTITNDDDGPPEPGARMFLGSHEIVDPDECLNHDSDDE